MSLDNPCFELTSSMGLFTPLGCGVNISASDVLLWGYLESSVHTVFSHCAYLIKKCQLYVFSFVCQYFYFCGFKGYLTLIWSLLPIRVRDYFRHG